MSVFLQPWMLWGLGLAAVPILIHLFARRRFTTVRWAAMSNGSGRSGKGCRSLFSSSHIA